MRIDFVSKFILLAIACLFLVYGANGTKKEGCKLCTDLVDNFLKGFKRTAKGNFGGGNTDWEDRKLGSYLTSETRFEEIIENICSDFDCHKMLEEHEDLLLDMFKQQQSQLEAILYTEFCIEKLKKCCPNDTYGADCSPCKRNLESNLTCSGNGECQGSGTRSGSGKCLCNQGYVSELCDQCDTGFYQLALTADSSRISCIECYKSCKKCTNGTENDCLECKNGWKFDDTTKLCNDINECLTIEKACKENEYCENTDGSFICYECDPSCDACTDKGNEKCVECRHGYRRSAASNACHDVNECEETPNVCDASKTCVNTQGSYICQGTDDTKYQKNSKKVKTQVDGKPVDESLLYKRTLITAISLLCALCSYYARHHVLIVLSIVFGIILNIVVD